MRGLTAGIIASSLPAPAGGGGGDPTTLTFQSSATSSATNGKITLPSDIIAGDMLVLFNRARSSSAQYESRPDVIPTGWTGVNSCNNGITTRIRCSMKIAVGGDASAVVQGMDGSAADRLICLVFRLDNPISSVIAAGKSCQVTSGNPTAQTVNSGSSPDLPLVVLGGLTATNLTGWSFSPAADGDVDIGTDSRFSYKIYNSSPANVTVDTSDVGANNSLASFYIRVTG